MKPQSTEDSGSNKNSNDLPIKTNHHGTSVARLGRGLGRLIPVNNQKLSTEKHAVEPKSKDTISTQIKQESTENKFPTSVPDVGKSRNPGGKSAVIESRIEEIELSKIRPNPRQPRTDFNVADLEKLASSIKSGGLLQPIVIRLVDGESNRYEIIAGERRWRAFQMLGKQTIPAIVIHASDEKSGTWALIENVHRSDLNPMDRAMSVRRLADEFTITHDQLAQKLSLDRSTITNLLRLAELDSVTAGLVRQGLISQGHAKALLGVLDLKSRATLADSTVRGEWSVRTLEREVQRISGSVGANVPRGTSTARKQTNVKDLETRLSQLLGTRVTINLGRKPNTGKVSMEFFSLDQFEGLIGRLGLKPDQIRLEN